MRAIVDTNVVVSGLLWHGAPHILLDRVRDGALTLISSPVLLAELADVLARPKFEQILTRSNTSRDYSLAEIQALAEIITPLPLPKPICRDPKDDELLALALAAQAELIVSGDDDLLALKRYEQIPIVAPAEALRILTGY